MSKTTSTEQESQQTPPPPKTEHKQQPEPAAAVPTANTPPPSPAAKPDKKVSGLSLKSIAQKRKLKEIQDKKQKVTEREANEDFTEEQLIAAWNAYIDRLKRKGRKILASILATDQPKVVDQTIKIELPNDTMKKEIEQEKGALMAFIKRKIHNTHIQLEIKVNKEVAKQFAFTPMEKYQKLREKNPLVDKLKNTFDLDI